MHAPRFLSLWLVALAALLALASPAGAISQSGVDAEVAAAKAAMMSEPQKAFELAQKAERSAAGLAMSPARTIVIATAQWLQGEALLRLDQPERARPLLAGALKLIAAKREPIKLRGDLMLSLGALQRQDGKTADALASYQQAFMVFQQLGEARSQSIALQSIALLYAAGNDNAQAAKYLRQAAELFDGDPMLSLSLHNSRGNMLLQLERYDEAESEYLQSLGIARSLKRPALEALVLGNVARAQVEAYRIDDAERTLEQGFALTRGADATALRQPLLATAARVALTRGQLRHAARLIDERFRGVDLATTTIASRDAHLFAYQIYAALGDEHRALVHLEALRRVTDEATKVATSTGAALMAAQFDYANQELKIANMKAEELRRNIEFERSSAKLQRIIFLGAGGATLAVIILLTVSLFAIRRSRNEVRDANEVLESTNTALEKALAAKTEFLATTSHEIRTPLNGILGMTQVMLADPRVDAATRERIGVVHGAGVTMRSLVDDILDVAKMETGNLTVERMPTDLPATLREVACMWREQARAKGLSFALDVDDAPGWILSDPARLRQILFNLLSNAIKFTEAGGIGVRAASAGERLHVAITDTGVGVDPDKCEEIFESFRQADTSTTRKFGGTGLGLTICRNLARALGGDIRVESVPGEGSTFIVDLPLEQADAPSAPAAARREGQMLILDRNPIARGTLRALFEPHAGTPRFVATPDEALAVFADEPVAVLLVDEAALKAAERDPFADLARLAAAAVDAGAASAVLWAKPDEPVREQVAATGIGQLIAKPVTAAALVGALFELPSEKSPENVPAKLVSRAA